MCLACSNFAVSQQRDTAPPSEVKPAQQGSPAARPTEPLDSNPQGRRRSENRNVTTTERTTDTAGDRREGNVDRQLAACLLDKNKAEVQVGKIAAERATDKDVKEFAEMMVQDHTKAAEKLERLVGSSEPNDRRSKIERQIGEQCLANLRKELKDKSGHEFDACYMGSQIAGHMQMVATLEVLSNETSGELRNIVKDSQPVVEKHLAHAKDIMKALDKPSSKSQASCDRSETRR